jgi:hypothetical protein
MSKASAWIPVRLSHLLRHCSVGAIVRGPDYLMTVKDIREWTDQYGNVGGRPIRYVDQVRAALEIQQELREPPIALVLGNGQLDGVPIPALRFPSWMRCPRCGLLHCRPWRGLPETEFPHCRESLVSSLRTKRCQGNPPGLEQVSWILVHPEGHMADVPWHFLAHRDARTPDQKQCGADGQEPYLRLLDKAQGMARHRLRCERCGAESLFGDRIQISYGRQRQQPWTQEKAELAEGAEFAEVLEINDARVHQSANSSALVIPPESRIHKGSVLDCLYCNSQKREQIGRARNPLARRSALRQIAAEFRCREADIESALREIEQGYPLYGRQLTPGLLLEAEYQALMEEIPGVADDEDFVTQHHTPVWKSLRESFSEDAKPGRIVDRIDRLIAVNRLKEVLVLRGFRRLGQEQTLVPPDIVGETDWLPALELYGEGVFFALDESRLALWETRPEVQARAEPALRRFAATGVRFDHEITPTPRFLLLHTLAHLLIRELETEAGYPAAALRERIYCTAGDLSMAGILVYVAVPDVVGSLGGLTELAAPERFLPLIAKVFDHAEWCSLDPVCAEHEGQGPNLLNRAACHACALVPETSCAYGNVLLDRGFIKGDPRLGLPGFLDGV